MRTCLLLCGHYRTFLECRSSIEDFVLRNSCDVFIETWDRINVGSSEVITEFDFSGLSNIRKLVIEDASWDVSDLVNDFKSNYDINRRSYKNVMSGSCDFKIGRYFSQYHKVDRNIENMREYESLNIS